jgi:hypothetical protein
MGDDMMRYLRLIAISLILFVTCANFLWALMATVPAGQEKSAKMLVRKENNISQEASQESQFVRIAELKSE